MRSIKPVSIIIPCFNSAPTLKACLQAITEQMENHDELIIVDDGSQDETLSIARAFSQIIITNSQNKGPGYSRNQGAQRALNDILVFIDSDVVISSGCINDIRHRISNDPDVALTCQVDLEKKESFFSDYKNLYLHFSFKEAAQKKVTYLYGSMFAISRKNFIPWPEGTRYLEDVLLLNQLTEKGLRTQMISDYPIKHLKEFNLFSLLKYDSIMGKYYFVYKLMFQNISTTTHVKLSQQCSILLIPVILLSTFYSLPLTLLFLTLLLFLNIKHILFCYQQRGPAFTLKSSMQLFMSYCAYLAGSFIGLLRYQKLKKCFT